MSADIKAAIERANHVRTAAFDQRDYNLAAAFIEVEEGLRAEKLAHEKPNRVQIQLQEELEQERKAREDDAQYWNERALTAERRASDAEAREQNEKTRNRTLVNAAVLSDQRSEAAEERLQSTNIELNYERQWRKEADQRATDLQARLTEVSAWAADLLVYLDVEVESLPEAEYKIYEEGYDKTIAGLQAAIAGWQTESAVTQEVETARTAEGVVPSTNPAPATAIHYTESGRAYKESDAVKTMRHCSDDGKPCPPAIPGKGRGDSQCEQNGVCQRIDMGTLPRASLAFGLPPTEPAATRDDAQRESSARLTSDPVDRLAPPADPALPGLELAAGICREIGKDWYGFDERKFHASVYLAQAIEAEIAKRTK